MNTNVRPSVKPRTLLPVSTHEQSAISEPQCNSEQWNADQDEKQIKPRIPRQDKCGRFAVEENGWHFVEGDEHNKPPVSPADSKRMTLNIFRRNIDNPFGDEFEEDMKDATLTTVPAGAFSLDSVTYSVESVVSTAPDSPESFLSDDQSCDSADLRISKKKSLQKMMSCPENNSANLDADSEAQIRCNSAGEFGDSIYEPISFYSSSDSGSSDFSRLIFSPGSPGTGLPISKDAAITQNQNAPAYSGDRGNGELSQCNDVYTELEEVENSDNVKLPSEKAQQVHVEFPPSSVSPKPGSKTHEYDEVAVEDGNVYVKTPVAPVLESRKTKTLNYNLHSRNSVVMEFDPLCQNNSYNITWEDLLSIENEVQVPSLTDGNNGGVSQPHPPHSSKSNKFKPARKSTADKVEQDTKLTQSPSTEKINEYESDSPTTSQVPESNFLPTNSMELGSSNGIDFPVSEIQAPRSTLKCAENLNQANFLRRLSNKLLQPRLVPIREEASPKRRSETRYLSSTKCSRCFEEHLEDAKCKFSPTPRENINYSAYLSKAAGLSKRDFVKRFAVLSKGKLTLSVKPEKILDTMHLEKIVVISRKEGQSPQDLKCFQLYFNSGRHSLVTLAGLSDKERSIWMQKLVEVYTSSFPTAITSLYDRAGWCFLKENLTGEWQPTWFVLVRGGRKLYYAFNNCEEYHEVDLRKVREIGRSEKDDQCPYVENNDILTIHAITKVLYVQTEIVKLTESWEKAIGSAALFNGSHFEEMQLTNDDVPVVVEKCLDFLYAHGTLCEGIFRQSGSNSRIAALLQAFKKDAWSVQISLSEYSAHDVAGNLKRFFRTLPEPLLTNLLYNRWIAGFGVTKKLDRLQKYQELLSELPPLNFNVLKRLISHLHAVHENRGKNLMPLDNLAPIWGPTLMSVDEGVENTSKLAQSYEIACAQCGVVRDLIENYYSLFQVDSQEKARERRFQEGLEKFHAGSVRRKPSGDMRVFVYLDVRDENAAISVTLTPNATAEAIVEHIIRNHCKGRNGDNLSLHEVILSKSLERPLFYSERVVDSILRWSNWDVDDKKDNYLILKQNTLYPALVPFAKSSSPAFGEFKYADSKSKSFRKCAFEFSGAKLKHLKDSKTPLELDSWNIEDIVWYIGHETKRTPPSRFNFTFIPRKSVFQRSKDEPYFGNVVSVNSQEDLDKFIAAMIVGEHPEGLYPP